ncbi:MAG: hypothetical protein HQK58_11335 [Deltaproteobacteria bacterium]|nr:hypothetical protein [Deltaproteobacteria bacterium]
MAIGRAWPRLNPWERMFTESIRGQILNGRQLTEKQEAVLWQVYNKAMVR